MQLSTICENWSNLEKFQDLLHEFKQEHMKKPKNWPGGGTVMNPNHQPSLCDLGQF